MGMNIKEFHKKYNKFRKIVKKRGITFFGLGCLPTDRNGNWDREVSDLLLDLLDYEPFLERIREGLGLND